jgi:hypothetical protein
LSLLNIRLISEIISNLAALDMNQMFSHINSKNTSGTVTVGEADSALTMYHVTDYY